MRCTRCGGALTTFSVGSTGESAVVCEACGFVGIVASHSAESGEAESWDQALSRFDKSVLPPEHTCQTERGETVSVPTDQSDPAIDPDRLEESVPVGESLRERERERDNDE